MTNPHVAATTASPISTAYGWLESGPLPDGIELIDVAQAVPGYPPPDDLISHLRAIDQVPLSKYGPVLGQPDLREATALDISNAYGAAISVSNVAITAGANQAFCLVTLAICDRGDEVIVPVPYYFNHDMWLRINGIRSVPLPCDERMLPAASDAAALIGKRTRAISLVTPNNPTGRVYPADLIAAFTDVAASNGIHLILDETYRDFRTTAEAAHTQFQDPGWDSTIVHLTSFSKVFSITGHRVGALVASSDLLVEVDKIADCITICPNRTGQAAALYGLSSLGPWVEENRRMMNRRVNQFCALMTESDSPYEVVSAGAYFAYVRHPFDGLTGTEVAKRLVTKHAVLALAGEMFGDDQHPFLRLAFANLDEAAIPELVERLNASAA